MEKKDLIQTITAMKVALQSGFSENKSDMKLAIKIAYGFAENTLNRLDTEDVEPKSDFTYDDENPDQIRQSIEEI